LILRPISKLHSRSPCLGQCDFWCHFVFRFLRQSYTIFQLQPIHETAKDAGTA